MSTIERSVACVIVQDKAGNIAMQHRDNIPTIVCPNEWGMFGGGIEAGETPVVAAVRELEEELNIQLDPAQLHPVGTFYNKPTREFFVFHCEAETLLHSATLGEGQDWGCFSAETVLSGSINNHKVVPHHLAIIHWFTTYHLPNHQL